MYSDPNIKATMSIMWLPAGYITRNTRDESYWEQRHSAVAANGGVVGDENYRDKDADTSPERSISMHQERVS
jgi:SP family sugar:H+ symporter-like MFS transporter